MHYKKHPDAAARLALDSKKVIIIPGFKEKIAHVLLKIFPTSLSLRFAGMGQKRKRAK
jgi:short-subunit dehydrogenase